MTYIDERIAGYFEALDHAGIARRDQLVIRSVDAWAEDAVTLPALDNLLACGPPIDALFCIADLIAAPALRSLHAAGLTVPEDVAVVGFDDERAAQLLNPQLTTIRQPYSEMGTQAVTLLQQAINGDPAPSTRIELPTTLVVRGSSTTR